MTKAPRLALLVTLLLAACADPPQSPPPLQLDYSALGKISLDVHDINFVDRHTSQLDLPPYVADQFHPGFNEAIKRWADDRLQATGVSGDAAVIIRKANLSVEALPIKTGLDVVMERQQGSKYTGHIEVDVEARGDHGYAYAYASAQATRYVTLPEDPVKAEREAAYNALLAGLMQDLNRSLDQSIHEHLGDFLVTSAPVMEPVPPMSPMPPPQSPGMAP
jgi:hypothetical protein